MEIIAMLQTWFFMLGETYGVNPLIFGAIYVGAIPLFTLSVAWLVSRYRAERSTLLPALAAMSCFISAYVYLFIAGENVPWWVYGVVVAFLLYAGWVSYAKVRHRLVEADNS